MRYLKYSAALLVQLIGTALVAAGLFGIIVPFKLQSYYALMLPGWIVFLIGSYVVSTGQRIKALISANDARVNGKPFTLYLRAFHQDSSRYAFHSFFRQLSLPVNYLAIQLTTSEQQIRMAFDDIGAFDALGKPGERLPKAGARRRYLTAENWQAVILQDMQEASMVAIRVADTPNLWWEVEQAWKVKPHDRLVFLLPQNRNEYDAFREQMQGRFGVHLDQMPFGRSREIVSGVLTFANDQPIVQWIDESLADMGLNRYHLASQMKSMLREPLRRAGIVPRNQPASLTHRLRALGIDLLITVAIVLTGWFIFDVNPVAVAGFVLFGFYAWELVFQGQTIGKLFYGLSVKDRHGVKPSLHQLIYRGMFKYLLGVGFFGVFPLVTLVSKSVVHDLISKTTVVKKAA